MQRFKYLMKSLWRCFIYANLLLVINIFVSITSMQFFAGGSNLAVRIVFLSLCLLFFIFCAFITGCAFGIKQYKEYYNNLLRRKPDSRDPLDYFEKRDMEYHWSKGFIMGILSNYPLYIMMIIYAFLSGTARANVGAAAKMLFGVFSSMIYTFDEGASILFLLLGAALVAIITGAGYIYGAMKVKDEKRKLQDLDNHLNSDDESNNG